jgi:hypothetical protein
VSRPLLAPALVAGNNSDSLSSLVDHPFVELRIHDEPNLQQPIQLGLDPRHKPSLLSRQEESDRPNHSEAKGSGKPSGWLFVQYEPLGTQFQTQTDDLMLAWTNSTTDGGRLPLLC